MMKVLKVFYGGTLIFFLIIILYLNMIWHNNKNVQMKIFDSVHSYVRSEDTPSIQQPANVVYNSMKLNRLGEVKRELTDLTANCETVYPANRIGRYIFSNPNLCTSVQNVDFIIIVHTKTTHFERRRRIRATFGSTSLFYPVQNRVAFLLGKTVNTSLMEMLWQEHRTYNDTVMGDFIDDYYNMTTKAVMGLRWVKDHCSNAAFVLKIDDDVLINMFTLVHLFLPHMKTTKRTMFCRIKLNHTIILNRDGKWKVDSHIFRNRTVYPYSFCQGFTVLLTHDLIDMLYQAATLTPFFWIDDIYVFGLLPYVIGNITFINYELHSYNLPSYKNAINCTLPHRLGCPMYAIIIKDTDYWSCWQTMTVVYRNVNRTAANFNY